VDTTIVLFILRVLMAITLWVFIGIAIWVILRERKSHTAGHPVAAELVRLEADGLAAQGIGAQYHLGSRAPIWIGRDPNCAIRIDNEFVSLQHARILWQAEQQAWWIEDHNSRNGTLVNSTRVMRSELNDGDVIVIGGVQYRFQLEPSSKMQPQLSR
jgi:hypothetical protein